MLLRTLKFKMKDSEKTHTIQLQGMKPYHMIQNQNHAVMLTTHQKQSCLIDLMLKRAFQANEPQQSYTYNSHDEFDLIECRITDHNSSWQILKTKSNHEVRRKINGIVRKSSLNAMKIAFKENSKEIQDLNVSDFFPVKIYHSLDHAKDAMNKQKDNQLFSGVPLFHLIATDCRKEFHHLQRQGLSWMERASSV